MNIIRVFPRHTNLTPTDDYAFIGDPPMVRPPADEVHISCTFTWDKPAAERLQKAWSQYYPIVKLGGPAYDDSGDEFVPGMYLKIGVTTTSRGCNNKCPWCLGWQREGSLRELPIVEGNIIQDNNLLQCSRRHIDNVFDMLSKQRDISFTGGIDARLVTQYIADRLRGLRIRRIFLACDTDDAIKPLRKALRLLQIPPHHHKVRCYVLLKYDPNETLLHALIRMLQVYEAGALPFAQLYQPPDQQIKYPADWRKFARIWERPAASYGYVTRVLKQLENSDV